MKDENHKQKKTSGLLFSFSLIFGFFTIATLIISAAAIYAVQMREYKAQKVEDIRNIGDYLERLIQESGEDFITYQKYYLEHFAEADIPFDFDEYHMAQRKYESLLARDGVKNVDSKNFDFDSFSEEAKMAYLVYIHEYWLLTFENARKTFNLPYTYYLVPKEDIYHMVYMIDGERTAKNANGEKTEQGEFLYLGDEYYDPPEKYQVQWRTWFTGKRQNDFEVWNNEWGHTYAYYTPLIINGKKLGLIGTEVEVAKVNKTILMTSIKISVCISLGLIACVILLLFFINTKYIKKIVVLESRMREFANEKNPSIAKRIQDEARGQNEISSLSRQFASLILELEEYMKNLLSTKKELNDTKILADEMNALAKKDALTGIRNKTAYDSEARRLEWKIADGETNFGIVMIDLNFLKRINDTYGHEQGDIAIKKLCIIICDIFKHSPVFRIGGDEFAVILENNDLENIDLLAAKFNSKIKLLAQDETLEPWEQVSAAIGWAVYNSSDKNLADVFRRADKNMYERKKEMKAQRVD